MSLLHVRRLCASYGPAPALHDIEFSIEEHEAVALLGPNGAGKSTLLNCIARLHRTASGSIELSGVEIIHAPGSRVARLGVSYVRERAPVIQRMTVEENLRLGEMLAARRGVAPLERSLVWSYFPALARRPKERAGLLSGGQRQMLALATAFVSRPRLLLLDEPSAGLAPSVAEPVFEAIAQLRAGGVTVLLAEQNADWVKGTATRGYVLESGRLAASGAAAGATGAAGAVRSAGSGSDERPMSPPDRHANGPDMASVRHRRPA